MALNKQVHIYSVDTSAFYLKEEKGIKAVEMSMNEYCSVSKMLAHSVEIGFTVEVRPDQWNEQM